MAYPVETRRQALDTPRPAERSVNTFVVRRWPPDHAGERYEIAHIQSGQRTVVTGTTSASAWIGEHSRPTTIPRATPGLTLAS